MIDLDYYYVRYVSIPDGPAKDLLDRLLSEVKREYFNRRFDLDNENKARRCRIDETARLIYAQRGPMPVLTAYHSAADLERGREAFLEEERAAARAKQGIE